MNKALYFNIIFILVLFVSLVSAIDVENTNIGFKDASNNALDNSVSGGFGQFTQSFFKYYGLDFNGIIILYVLFFVILFVLLDVISLVPFFESKVVQFFAAIIISLLIAISGAYADVAAFLFDISIKLTSGWNIFAIIIAVAILVALGLIMREIARYVKEKSDKAKAHIDGFKLASDVAVNNAYRKMHGE